VAERAVTIGRASKKFSVTGRKAQIFPFPSRFGGITKTQHFVTTPLTWHDSCLR